MTWRNEPIRTKAIEKFRFFDDFHPAVREAVRCCNYDIKLNEIMSMQHAYYQQGKPLEDLAADILRRDHATFVQRSKLPPNQRYPRRDEVLF